MKIELPLEVLKSAAGFYIGRSKDGLPYSRDSVEYWKDKSEAEKALKNNTYTPRNNS
jgi:hypothetical protein